jgi:hypothetical protein
MSECTGAFEEGGVGEFALPEPRDFFGAGVVEKETN